MLKAIFLFVLFGVCVIVSVNKQLCGSLSQPVEIQEKYLEKILLNKERVKEYAHLIKDVKDSKEAEAVSYTHLTLPTNREV